MRDLKLGKVDLGLVARLCFKTHIGDLLALALYLADPAFDDFIATGKPHVHQSVVNPGGGIVVFGKPGFYITSIRGTKYD